VDPRPSPSKVTEVIAEVRSALAEANGILFRSRHMDLDWDEKSRISSYLERAFIQMLVLLEAAALPEIFEAVKLLNERASEDFSEIAHADGPYLIWGEKLRDYADAVAQTMGTADMGTVTKDVTESLRHSVYGITDRKCFPAPPANEKEVHTRIEAILRCVFPDLRNRPPIPKPIKNFEADTGLPEVRTLIEYKFIATESDAKRVADEVLADTRGYTSKDWEVFIYLIYQTRPIKPERQWRQLLRETGLSSNTSVVVISGEEPHRSARRGEKHRCRARMRPSGP
jgi:hypothetical protein